MTEPPETSGPVEVPCTFVGIAARYTSLDQFAYFRDKINWWYAQDTNVRIDPDDPEGRRIRWYWAYYLPFGEYLYVGASHLLSCSEAELRQSVRPHPDWPQDLISLFGKVGGKRS